MTEQEKDELFAEFMVRMAEMNKEEKRLSATKNNKAMIDLTEYFNQKIGRYSGGWTEDNKWLYRKEEGWWYFAADGIYDAYLALRRAVPYIVGTKRALDGERPKNRNEGYRKQYVLDPEKDREEANKIGMILIDAMIGYLKGGEENA